MFRKIIICALFFGLAVTAHAQKVEIIMATLAPQDSAWFKVIENMGAEWKKISGGNVTLSIRAGGVVGDEPDCVRRLRLGSIQAAELTSAGLGDIDQGVACLQIPMMFDSYEELDYVRDRIGPKLEKRIEDKGFMLLNWGDAGWVRFFSTKRVTRLDDLRKLRLFTWAGDPTEEELWKTAGFHVVPLAATDIGQQLETHGIDAVPTTALYAETADLYKIANNMCDVKWAPLVGATIVSKAAWEKIPAAQRGAMLEAARKSGDALKGDIRAQDTRAIATMAAGQTGHRAIKLTITTLDAAAMADWRKQTEAVYPKMKGKMVPADLFDEVQRLRDEYRAQHPAKTPEKVDATNTAQSAPPGKGATKGKGK
jgi:TRAP-type C4-dicarboxylate transport system substrate-binding protein